VSLLPRVDPAATGRLRRRPVDPDTLAAAAAIVEDVRAGGEAALRHHAARLGDIGSLDPLVVDREGLDDAVGSLDPGRREMLERVASRIRGFAAAQRAGLGDLDVAVPGGRAGHRWLPVGCVGAYAPGGRYPLPSTVLMTVIPARVAGVGQVWVASPRPTPVTMAAAGLAGADGLLRVGGAQAIAALAFGTVSPACDVVVGPGNRWVTAAKKHLYGEVGIDGLAGPSEILIIADGAADAAVVAADLLAQAEHDPQAVPMLVTTAAAVVDAVEEEIVAQLEDLPTSVTTTAALGHGFSAVVGSIDEAIGLSDRLAPEHVALHVADPDAVAGRLTSFGSLFVGGGSAEVFADYGAGPNHVLPTGGGARFQSGLSVSTFLRSPTWTTLDEPAALVADTALLARLEGLEAHARAAERRAGGAVSQSDR
jgi:phosphoribosyl-ATP pyrophosphohydrolase/phosphoribosyl-AMP cyclohydrolase/histidinol dehydrogenase